MKNFLSILVLFLFPILINGQVIQKNSSESYEEFALKNKPKNSEKISFIKIKKWNSKEGIFVFYDEKFNEENSTSYTQTHSRLIGNLFIQTSNDNEYKRVLIDTINQEGGNPKIEDLFFTNADNDPNEELIIITSWNQKHYQINGKLYGTFVYDELENFNRNHLVFLKDISEIVDGGFDGNREGEIVESKFKNREEIISKLKEMTN